MSDRHLLVSSLYTREPLYHGAPTTDRRSGIAPLTRVGPVPRTAARAVETLKRRVCSLRNGLSVAEPVQTYEDVACTSVQVDPALVPGTYFLGVTAERRQDFPGRETGRLWAGQNGIQWWERLTRVLIPNRVLKGTGTSVSMW